MFSVIEGNYFLTITIIAVGALILYYMKRVVAEGKIPTIRRIAGLDAIEEAVGRATELGKPVHFSPGVADVTVQEAAQTFAAMEILGYVAELCAKYNTELIATVMRPNVFPLTRETARVAYAKAGRPELFTERTVRYLGNDDQAYAWGVIGILRREKPAANLLMGGFWGTSVALAEAGAAAGCIQVAGTANLHQLPFLIASCDYCLIGEELYVAGAYLAKDVAKIGTTAGQDVVKVAVTVLLILGAVLATANVSFLADLLKL